jgi:hypothetical protein
MKTKKMLNFPKIIQSWIRDEEKDVDIESTKNKIKYSCPTCMDSIKSETSTFCGHIFYEICILGVINVQNTCPIC